MIYCHIPFCRRKCTYCAFYSLAGNHDKQRYIDAICREIELRSRHYDGHPITTVYFGGGTPTQLSVSQIGQVVTTLRSCFNLSGLKECTIEANPDDLTDAYLQQLVQLSFFNRISIGVQSFNDDQLAVIGRTHDGRRAIDAVLEAHRHGFDNITIDLIYGLPNQSTDDWLHQLDQVEALPISHLSCYALTVEPKTILDQQIRKGLVHPADEAVAISQYEALCQWIVRHQWQQYEVSNFCKNGKKSLHNSRYWNRTPYWGFGAAAHSFDGTNRRWNTANLREYCSGVEQNQDYFEQESLTILDAFNEYVMTSLRTNEGIDKRVVDKHFAPYSHCLQDNMQPYIKAGLIIDSAIAYQPTTEGLLHADGIASELFLLE